MVNVIFKLKFHKSSCWTTKGGVPGMTLPLNKLVFLNSLVWKRGKDIIGLSPITFISAIEDVIG